MMNPLTPETYVDLFERFGRDAVRYVVVSGVAVVLHGHVRPVFDLDIVVAPAHEESSRAMRSLALAGFVPTIPLPLSAVTVLRTFDHTQREVDVFARYSIPFDELWADSQLVPVGGTEARVISLAHLLHAKRFNGRPHDLLDIEVLLALGPRDGQG